MNRHFFRRFEREGNGQDAAWALALLGVAAAHPGLGLERLLAGERLEPGELAPGGWLRFGFSPADRDALEQFLALWPMHVRGLAAQWRNLVAKLGPPRLEIAHSDENPDVLGFFAELLLLEFVGAASVHVRARVPRLKLKRPLSWPLGIMTEPAQRRHIEALRQQMPGGDGLVQWFPFNDQDLGEVLQVPSSLAFVPGAPGHQVWDMPPSTLAVAFIAKGKSAADAMALGLKLRYRLETSAVLVVRASRQEREDFWLGLLGELCGGRALDEVVLRSSRSRPAAFLLSSREFLENAKLPARQAQGPAGELRQLSESLKDRFELVDLALPEPLARTLGLEQRQVGAPELAAALRQLTSAPGFETQPGLGVALAQLRRAVIAAEQGLQVPLSQHNQSAPTGPVKPERPPPPRYLQANIVSTEGGEAVLQPGALLAERTYQVEVHIGRVHPGTRFVWKPLPEGSLPPSPTGHELTVVFADISGGREPPPPRAERIHLGPEGDSTRATFEFSTPTLRQPGASEGRFSARIAVVYRNRVLQTALLSAPVVASPEARTRVRRGVEQRVELPPAASSELLDERTPFDAVLVLNHDAAGAAGAMVVEDDEVRWLPIDQVDLAVLTDRLRARLGELNQSEDRPQGLDDWRLVKLLIMLANRGTLLWRRAIDVPGVGPGLRHGRRIQVLEATMGTFVPVEFFYELPAPDDDAQLCPGALQALETGTCNHPAHQDEEAARSYVCPSGFWGFTRVIERQRADSREQPRGVARLNPLPRRAPRTIPILQKGLLGASHRVDLHDASSLARVRQTLKTVWPGCTREVTGWREWVKAVAQDAPSLLVLLVHTDVHEELEVPTIEIADKALKVSHIEPYHVRQKASQGGVLVLLLGCSPVLPEVRFEDVVSQLLRAGQGSSVVVSSIADMLGRHVGPTTAELLAGLGALVSQGAVSVGDAFIHLRRKLLAAGDPLMLSLAVYGDVDWLLIAPERAEGTQALTAAE